MALSTLPDDASSPWETPIAAPHPSSEPTVQSALEKERVIKDILSLRDGLRGLMVRLTEVEGENDELGRDNEMLGIYIDNLCVASSCERHNGRRLIDCKRTRNSVVAAGNKR